jgi:hypothetical protein
LFPQLHSPAVDNALAIAIGKLQSSLCLTLSNYSASVVKPIINSGIGRVERVPIPDELLPEDAKVEIVPKKAIGYYTQDLRIVSICGVFLIILSNIYTTISVFA